MRVTRGDCHFRVRAIAGTHVVLVAFDMDEATRQGLRGFAVKRGLDGEQQEWLRGIKYFAATVPSPDAKADYASNEQPYHITLISGTHADPLRRVFCLQSIPNGRVDFCPTRF